MQKCVILSEAKDLTIVRTIRRRFFASLRMNAK